MSSSTRRRRATHAGSWYDSSSVALQRSLSSWLQHAASNGDLQAPQGHTVHAIIAPHAGYSYSGPTAAYAYAAINAARFSRVFILGPSHHVYLRDRCAVTDAHVLDTPVGPLPVDRDVVDGLLQQGYRDSSDGRGGGGGGSRGDSISGSTNHNNNTNSHHHLNNHTNSNNNTNTRHQQQHDLDDLTFVKMSLDMDEAEHSIEMHLPYVRQVFSSPDVKVVPIVVGALSEAKERQFGRALSSWLGDGETFFVVSSDFCHWGTRFRYTMRTHDLPIWRSIERLDHEGMEIIEMGDHAEFCRYQYRTENTICGRHPIGVLMAALSACSAASDNHVRFHTKFVKYKQSSKCLKLSDSSVSYASALVYTPDHNNGGGDYE